jgi:hypothetical protein
MIIFKKFRNVIWAFVVVILALMCGCGDETSRMAGTIDMPKKEHAQPSGKGFAKTGHDSKAAKR